MGSEKAKRSLSALRAKKKIFPCKTTTIGGEIQLTRWKIVDPWKTEKSIPWWKRVNAGWRKVHKKRWFCTISRSVCQNSSNLEMLYLVCWIVLNVVEIIIKFRQILTQKYIWLRSQFCWQRYLKCTTIQSNRVSSKQRWEMLSFQFFTVEVLCSYTCTPHTVEFCTLTTHIYKYSSIGVLGHKCPIIKIIEHDAKDGSHVGSRRGPAERWNPRSMRYPNSKPIADLIGQTYCFNS